MSQILRLGMAVVASTLISLPAGPLRAQSDPLAEFGIGADIPVEPQQGAPANRAMQDSFPFDQSLEAVLADSLAEQQASQPQPIPETYGVPDDIRAEAWELAAQPLLPMTPQEIQRLLDRMSDSQKAAAGFPQDAEPTPEVTVRTLSMDPGVMPPEIRLHQGFVTTLSMFDATGAPWPIRNFGVGGQFQVPQPEQESHILRITPQGRHAIGNLSIRLLGLATPITFRLRSGTDIVHYRYDARVPEFGPGAKAPLIDQGLTRVAGDALLMSILDGVPPAEAEALQIDGADERTRAWSMGDQLYLRTPLTLLSPGWQRSVSSADGMKVYAVTQTPVLLLSDNGLMVRATVRRGIGG